MRRILGLLVVGGLVGVAVAAPAARTGRGTKLVYPSNRTGNAELFLMNLDGSDPVNLTSNPGQDLFPAWSPDGKKIAFSSDRNGTSAIYVMDADGKHVQQLTRTTDADRAPAWSPDGKTIAFVRQVDGSNMEIFVMDADGSNAKNLTNNAAYDADPAWSPDGKQIVFASNRDGMGFRVYVMDADGSNVVDVSKTDNPNGYVYPAWSPDGKKIAFAEPMGDALEIVVCAPDGSDKKSLTKLGGRNSHACWSPDGKKIAFQHVDDQAEAAMLYMMNADGSDAKPVFDKAEGIAEGGRPAWKPR